VAGSRVTVRRLETNAIVEDQSDLTGRFRFLALPVGSYELTIEKTGFARYTQGPIILRLNQEAELEVKLEVAGVSQDVTVNSDAPLINTTNAEVGVNFDSKRISELPLTPSRYVLNLALSVAGVSPVHDGQRITGFPAGSLLLAVNGMRVRSNNMMIDGQDSTNAQQNGEAQPLNNPDIVAEFRLLTNQFAPEYGRAAGSVINLITKSGGNQFHGTAFWFHNDNHLNSRNNLDKLLTASSPFRAENQFGGTLGGPVVKAKTFFFGSLQRWTDRRFSGGTSFQGAPTAEGRALLESLAGDQPTVKILLEHVPAAQAPVAGLSKPLRVGGRTVDIPLGTLSGTSNIRFNDWQWSARLDHRLNDKHTLGGRYLFDDRINSGNGQSVPPGLTDVSMSRSQSVSTVLNSSVRNVFHELHLSYKRTASKNEGTDPAAGRIPSIEVTELGLNLFQSGPNRTALGLATNLPNANFANTYQIQDTWSVLRGAHSIKLGLDLRRSDFTIFFPQNIRGRMVYTSLQELVNDMAQTALITSPLAGSEIFQHYRYNDYSFFLQDQWRIHPSLAITYGVRYELPGNSFERLREVNRRIIAAAGGDLRFSAGALPRQDRDNWAPRLGFNYRFAKGRGILRRITGDGKLVARGGYSRTYDQIFVNLARTVALGFPFVRSDRLPPRTPNSLERLRTVASTPIADPDRQSRQPVAADLRSPVAEQFALQLQRELKTDWALSVGYVATKGTALFELVDGNPTVPGSGGRQRVDPNRGTISLRCNCGSSIFHSLQTSLEKRLSSNFSMASHYTWSAFIDGASDAFSATISNGEVGIAQDAFNRRADRGRSTFDRPHRFVANGVFELPFRPAQKGFAGALLGGWQLGGFLTFQSGAPFSALDGDDPGSRLGGIVPSVRANRDTSLDLAGMSVEQILAAGGARLFRHVTAAEPLGNLGRNVLRSDGIGNLDLGLFKNTRLRESRILQFRAELYNATNTRNFGIPASSLSSPNFLNQWGLDGGNRRIVLALRYVF
jgi:hypothetical protein